jgi:glycine betaine/proline transport system substrate-binding protein
MKRNIVWRRTGVAAGLLALGLTAACGSDGGDSGSEGAGGGGKESITLGINPAWTDSLSTAYLWEHVLEEEGYEVEIEEIADLGLLFTGVAKGDIDVYPSAWPEVTQQSYVEEYDDQLEDLGAWYENAKLTLTVPEYTDVDSIADLADNTELFDGKITGMEAGAGLTIIVNEQVIPQYGLDKAGYTLVNSSTTAMLAALDKAIKAEEDIVVNLWKPFWANSKYPVKDLKDPEGALGEPETLNAMATAGFSDEHPEVAEMFGNFKLSDEEYGSLENMVVNEYGLGKEAEAVDAWIEEHPDFIKSLKD